MAFVRRLLCMAALAGAADVYYTLDLTWETGSPNGLQRDMIFVNNQFPGPPMILDEGDDVTVRTRPDQFAKMVFLTRAGSCSQPYALQHDSPFPWNRVCTLFLYRSTYLTEVGNWVPHGPMAYLA